MTSTLTQLQVWMGAAEGEHLEFKEAKGNFLGAPRFVADGQRSSPNLPEPPVSVEIVC